MLALALTTLCARLEEFARTGLLRHIGFVVAENVAAAIFVDRLTYCSAAPGVIGKSGRGRRGREKEGRGWEGFEKSGI